MTSFVNVCNVKSAEKRYAFHLIDALGYLWSGKKEFWLKGFISLAVEEINLSRQKQTYQFYLFDKSW